MLSYYASFFKPRTFNVDIIASTIRLTSVYSQVMVGVFVCCGRHVRNKALGPRCGYAIRLDFEYLFDTALAVGRLHKPPIGHAYLSSILPPRPCCLLGENTYRIAIGLGQVSVHSSNPIEWSNGQEIEPHDYAS